MRRLPRHALCTTLAALVATVMFGCTAGTIGYSGGAGGGGGSGGTVATDGDGDGVDDSVDNCPSVANPTQTDTDTDGIGDACDNCPADANDTQTDTDSDTVGDACDPCPSSALDDSDGDGVCDDVDRCAGIDDSECDAPVCAGLLLQQRTCSPGDCTQITVLANCDDGDPCTTDACDVSGCTNTPKAPGGSCGLCSACDGAGNCVDDLTQNQLCPTCQQCGSGGTCVDQAAGIDLKNECVADLCKTGGCDGAGACAAEALGTGCGVCATCDDLGACIDDLTQDAQCGTCEECAAGGTCVAQAAGGDVKNECSNGAFCDGLETCSGAGACGASPGDPCAAPTTCDVGLGTCTGCNTDADCLACQTCDTGTGNCVDAAQGTDVKNDCATGSCASGDCDGNGLCENLAQGTDCDTCGACDNTGVCLYDGTQDGDCGTCQQCAALATCVDQAAGDDVNSDCDDGTFCNGVETCDGASACAASPGDPCAGGTPICDEASSGCFACMVDADCLPCQMCSANACVPQAAGSDLKNDCDSTSNPCMTGSCDGSGACAALPFGNDCGVCGACDGSAQCVYDDTQDADCTAACQECSDLGTCANQASGSDVNDECDNGQFCDGAEACDGAGACQAAGPGDPCISPATCDEIGDVCTGCIDDSDCAFCQECAAGTCQDQVGTDTKNECEKTTNPCFTGNCDGSGVCALEPLNADCGICSACDASGSCTIYDATQDADCAAIGVCLQCSAVGTCDNQGVGFDLNNECGNGSYCDGNEACDGAGACQVTGPGDPCISPLVCDETTNGCVECADDFDCPACEMCTANVCVLQAAGFDSKNDCDDVANPCLAGTCDGAGGCNPIPINVDCGVCSNCDGNGACNVYDATQDLDCTATCQECSDVGLCADQAAGSDVNGDCSNGTFCDGDEVCDGAGACDATSPGDPCTPQACDETTDSCGCITDSDCGPCEECDGVSSQCQNQVGTDVKNDCDSSANPCLTGICDGSGACATAAINSDCGICSVCNASGQCNVYDDLQDGDCAACQECSALGACANQSAGFDIKGECSNGIFCDGDELCDGAGACLATGPGDPCTAPATCNETAAACFVDSDGDGISDDGDNSGVVGDALCPDGIAVNCDDNCRYVANPGQADGDGDGVGDDCDNCPAVSNPGQGDADRDGNGDACDADSDADGVPDNWDGTGLPGDDPCPHLVTIDCDDNCQFVKNSAQDDIDGDGLGDVCDPDSDGDTVLDNGDGIGLPGDNPCDDALIAGCDDNCPLIVNPLQLDSDGDGLGDLCDACPLVAGSLSGCFGGSGCMADASICDFAGQCCSLYCSGGVCATGGVCASITEACSADTDCCSNNCDTASTGLCLDTGGTCLSGGENCANNGECCSDTCDSSSSPSKCAIFPLCRIEGEVCQVGTDCCTGSCVDAGGGVLTCATLDYPGALPDECLVVGEICWATGDCCSNACTMPAGGSSNDDRCAFLGGCRVIGDLCGRDTDCCSFVCAMTPDGVKRCDPYPGCVDTGGTCLANDSVGCSMRGELCQNKGECCENESVIGNPCPVVAGKAKRCTQGDALACQQDGDICAVPTDCCNGMCIQDNTGTFRCGGCLVDGSSCTDPLSCCGGVCEPWPSLNGELHCGTDPFCAVDGAPCLTAADCCGGQCTDAGSGFTCGCLAFETLCTAGADCCGGVCAPWPNRYAGALHCGSEPCFADGDTCTTGSECCSGECNDDGTGLKCGCLAFEAACQASPAGCCGGQTCEAWPIAYGGDLHCGSECSSLLADGDACTVDGDCCSGQCNDDGTGLKCGCLAFEASCAAAGRCCGGICDPWDNKYGGALHCGVEPCTVDGLACTVGADCCGGQCTDDGSGLECGCLAFEATCSVGADCCGGLPCEPWNITYAGALHCGTDTGCLPEGATCTAASDCCGTAPYCEDFEDGNGFVCATSQFCKADGQACSVNDDCCAYCCQPTPTSVCFDAGSGQVCTPIF